MRHKPLILPEDTAWDRNSLYKKFAPIWIKRILEGIQNIFRWAPTIYKDKNWDSHYIFEIIKFKLLQQRNHLVKDNRHEGISTLNRDITICLKLIELIQDDYYNLEYMDYHKSKYNWEDCEDEIPGTKKLEIVEISEHFDDYFNKHKASVRKVKNSMGLPEDKKRLAMALAHYNQKRCQALLFKIMNEKINR